MTGFRWQAFETSAARVYGLIVSAAILFLTARALGPENQGTVAAAVSWVGLFATFSGLSLGHVSQFRIQAHKDRLWLPPVMGTLLVVLLAMTLVSYAVSAILYGYSEGRVFGEIARPVLAIAFLLLPLLIWETYSNNLLLAAGRVRECNLAHALGRTIWLICVVVFLYLLDKGIYGALVAQTIGYGVAGLFAGYVLWVAAERKPHFDRLEIEHLLRGSLKLHLNTIGSFLLGQAGILVLNHYAFRSEAGWYQIAFQMAMVLIVIPQSVSMVLFSRMAAIGPDRLWHDQKRMIVETLGLMLLISALAYLLMPIFIDILIGPSFKPSSDAFRMLLPVVFGMSFAQLMTPQWIGRGIFFTTTIITIGTAAINLAITLYLVPRFGISGAVWSNLVCYAGIAPLAQGVFFAWCERSSNRAGAVG